MLKLFRKIPRRLISILFLGAILVFLALYLKSINYHQLIHLHFEWSWLIIGSAIAVAYRYMAVFIWRVIMRSLGTKRLPPFSVMTDVFAKAWMARYIPGTVTWIAGRIYMASSYGISKSRLTVSSLLEGGMQVVAGIVVALPLIGFDSRASHISWEIKALSVIISLGCLVALLPAVFNRLLHVAHVIIKKKQPGPELRVNTQAVVRSFILFAIADVITGAANYMVARSIDPHLHFSLFFYLVGTFSLAGALGIATPFLPSGIGVRDGVQIILLSLVMPKSLALAVTVLSRFWGLAVDVIFFGMATLWYRLRKDALTPPVPPLHGEN
jgi:hypothetical protein